MHELEPPGRARPWRRLRPLLAALVAAVAALVGPAAASANVTGVKHVMVLRVYFHDYAATSHFTQSAVHGLFDNQLNTLWKNNSYGQISLSTQVTTSTSCRRTAAPTSTTTPTATSPATASSTSC